MFISKLSPEQAAFIPEQQKPQIKSLEDYQRYVSGLAEIAKFKKIPEDLSPSAKALANFSSRLENLSIEELKTSSEGKIPEDASISAEALESLASRLESLSIEELKKRTSEEKIHQLAEMLWPKYEKEKLKKKYAPKSKEAIVTSEVTLAKNEIVKNLFLGSEMDALKAFKLKTPYILSLVDLRKYKFPFPEEVRHACFPVEAMDWDALIKATSTNIDDKKKWFDKAFDILDKALLENKSVFVHCKAGEERSPALIIAYLMRRFNYSYEEAYKTVKQARPVIKVYEKSSLENGLRSYQDFLQKKRSAKQSM